MAEQQKAWQVTVALPFQARTWFDVLVQIVASDGILHILDSDGKLLATAPLAATLIEWTFPDVKEDETSDGEEPQ
jgi:hypothetical protein